MKCLVFILAIGLLLLSSARSMRPNGMNMDEEFTNLCGQDYKRKVIEICGGAPWKPFPPHPFQARDDNDDFEQASRKNDQSFYNNNGIDLLESDYGPRSSDNNYFEQLPNGFDDSLSQSERISAMQIALSKVVDEKLSRKCCTRSCAARELYRLC